MDPYNLNSSANTLNNFNSVKSKKFQAHTRKLIQISLDMLLKSQVPTVQFIALTTINRIFDIYVYHGLFYPGHYDSCYIPAGKRKVKTETAISGRREQQTALENIFNNMTTIPSNLNNAGNETNSNNDSGNDSSSTHTLAKNASDSENFTTSSVNLKLNKKPKNRTNDNNVQYCTCIRPVRKTVVEYRVRERTSTIKEDPSSIENEDNDVLTALNINTSTNKTLDDENQSSSNTTSPSSTHNANVASASSTSSQQPVIEPKTMILTSTASKSILKQSSVTTSLSSNRSSQAPQPAASLRSTITNRLSGFLRKFSISSIQPVTTLAANNNDSNRIGTLTENSSSSSGSNDMPCPLCLKPIKITSDMESGGGGGGKNKSRASRSSLLQMQNSHSSQEDRSNEIERDFTSSILIGDLTNSMFKEDLKSLKKVTG